jgi:hypothetical protein
MAPVLAPGTQARAPYAIDPVLNRGVVLEQLGAFDAAIADYNAVLAVSPADPAAWNNRGNARMGKGEYAGAAEDYGKAVALAPAFSFAAANRSIALYAAGALCCVCVCCGVGGVSARVDVGSCGASPCASWAHFICVLCDCAAQVSVWRRSGPCARCCGATRTSRTVRTLLTWPAGMHACCVHACAPHALTLFVCCVLCACAQCVRRWRRRCGRTGRARRRRASGTGWTTRGARWAHAKQRHLLCSAPFSAFMRAERAVLPCARAATQVQGPRVAAPRPPLAARARRHAVCALVQRMRRRRCLFTDCARAAADDAVRPMTPLADGLEAFLDLKGT